MSLRTGALRAALLMGVAVPALALLSARAEEAPPTLDTAIVTASPDPEDPPGFVDIRNLAHKAYISNVQAQVRATAASAAYWPGDGRSVFGGVTWTY